MKNEKLKIVALILIVLAGLRGIASSDHDRLGMPGTVDWIAYWSASRLAASGENPYDEAKQRAVERGLGLSEAEPVVRMWNPPGLLVLLRPVTLLPFYASAKLWFLLNVSAMLACGTVVWKIVAGPQLRRRLAVAWMASAAFIPLLIMLHMGQVSGILLVGVVGFFACAERGRSAAAGAFLALTLIKPHVVHLVWIAAIYWMIRGRKWSFAIGAGAVLATSIVALASIGPQAGAGYRAILAHPPLFYRTPTLGGILRDLAFRDRPTVPIWFALVTEVIFLGFLIVKRPVLVWNRDLGPILLASVPTAAYGWCFDQTVLLVPYLMIVARLLALDRPADSRRKAVGFACLFVIGAGMIAQNAQNLNDVYMFWPPLALAVVFWTTKAEWRLTLKEAIA